MNDVIAAESALRKLLERVAKDQKWDPETIKISPILSGGANYSSTLFLATASSNSRQDKLFAKVAIMPEKMREAFNGNFIYQVENYVYNKLVHIYASIEEDHKLADENRLPFPKYYTHDSEQGMETLVLEDLSARGFVSFSRKAPVSWEYASQSMSQLAKMHALSFAFQAQQPEEFKKMTELFKFDVPMDALEPVLETSKAVVRVDNLIVLERFITDSAGKLQFMFVAGTHPVLAHGDYRVSNQMYRRHNGKIQIVPVDYQTVNYGNAANDVLYFIFTATDQKFRKHHYKNLIEFYYEQLGAKLKRLGLEIATTYPRKDFNEDIANVLPHMLVVAAMLLPIVLVNEEDAPKFTGEDKDMIIKPSVLLPERLNGIIDDLVDWGVFKR